MDWFVGWDNGLVCWYNGRGSIYGRSTRSAIYSAKTTFSSKRKNHEKCLNPKITSSKNHSVPSLIQIDQKKKFIWLYNIKFKRMSLKLHFLFFSWNLVQSKENHFAVNKLFIDRT
jgi:hypothetical protein